MIRARSLGAPKKVLEGVGLVAHRLDPVPDALAADGQGEGAESAGAEGVLAALARDERTGDLDARHGRVRGARGQVVADPLDLAGRQAALAENGAGGVAGDRAELEPLVGGGQFVARVGSDGEGQGAVREGGGEALQRGDDPLGEDGGGAAAEDAGIAGGGADEGDGPAGGGVEGQGAALAGHGLVADEDEAPGGDLAGQCRAVDGGRDLGDDGGGPLQDPDACGEAQDVADGLVDGGLGHLPGTDGVGERGSVDGGGAGHGHIEAAEDVAGGGAGGHPVGDVVPVEAPLGAQDFVDEVGVLGHRDAVDLVVGRHDAPRVGVGDDGLEGRQVQLAQRARGDDAVDGEPLGLGVVADEVLDGGTDSAVLDSVDVAAAHRAGEVRVLGVALEVPAAERRAVQVHGGREEDVDALAAGFLREEAAGPPGERGVPGCGEGGRRGQGDRRVLRGPAHAAHPDGAVGHDQGLQPDLGEVGQGPHVPTGQEPGLGVEIQLAQRRLDGVVADLIGIGHGRASSLESGAIGVLGSMVDPLPGER